MSSVEVQLDSLAELGALDESLESTRDKLRSLPEELEAVEQEIANLETMLERDEARLDETKVSLRLERSNLDDLKEALTRAHQKQESATDLRQSDAADKEVDGAKKRIKEQEQKIGDIELALKGIESTFEKRFEQVENAKAEGQEEERRIERALESARSKVAAAEEKRVLFTRHLSSNVLRRYEKLKDRKGGAVSSTSDGTCSRCRMKLPPQLMIEVRKAEAVHNCPQCQSFIIFKLSAGV